MFDLDTALEVANRTLEQLKPHCERIEIAGSIRRRSSRFVKDIEILAIPKPYDNNGLFVSGLATVVNEWPKLKGELPCLYTKRLLKEGIVLDLFMCRPENWGLIFMIRTGPWTFSKLMVGTWLPKAGYRSVNGDLIHVQTAEVMQTPEEEDIFKLANMKFIEPKNRE